MVRKAAWVDRVEATDTPIESISGCCGRAAPPHSGYSFCLGWKRASRYVHALWRDDELGHAFFAVEGRRSRIPPICRCLPVY